VPAKKVLSAHSSVQLECQLFFLILALLMQNHPLSFS